LSTSEVLVCSSSPGDDQGLIILDPDEGVGPSRHEGWDSEAEFLHAVDVIRLRDLGPDRHLDIVVADHGWHEGY
jgi:hypothetical protein